MLLIKNVPHTRIGHWEIIWFLLEHIVFQPRPLIWPSEDLTSHQQNRIRIEAKFSRRPPGTKLKLVSKAINFSPKTPWSGLICGAEASKVYFFYSMLAVYIESGIYGKMILSLPVDNFHELINCSHLHNSKAQQFFGWKYCLTQKLIYTVCKVNV